MSYHQVGLPHHRPSRTTERRGIYVALGELERMGFVATEVPNHFDNGYDVFVQPHQEGQVLPAMASIQLRTGSSHHGRISVDRHAAYWRDAPIPVFGLLIPDPDAPTGLWCDISAYLKQHPHARSVPATEPFPGSLGGAIRAAGYRATAHQVLLDVFDTDPHRRAAALASLAPLADDPRLARLVRSHLEAFGHVETYWAVRLLLIAQDGDVDTGFATRDAMTVLEALTDDVDPWHLDTYQAGTAYVYALLAARRTDPFRLLTEAIQASNSTAVTFGLAMAVSLGGARGSEVLDEALRLQPRLYESPDVQQIAQAIAEDGGYNFAW